MNRRVLASRRALLPAACLAASLAVVAWGCRSAPPPGGDAGAGGLEPGGAVSSESGGDAVPVPEAFSLLGEPLFRPGLPDALRAEREEQLAEARARYEADPGDPDALIWLGRRTAYLGRYREAAALFSRGVERFPEDARFLRHRGHRFLTLRRLDLAEADLARAGELVRGRPDRVEPDGLPNERGIPTSTLQSNVWYHLGLARFARGDFEGALEAYRECLAVSGNPDMLVATSHWLYMTLRRLGRDGEAGEVLEPIHADLDVIENHAYHRLLLLYRGELAAEDLLADVEAGSLDFATLAFGVAHLHLVEGRRAEAETLFRHIVESGRDDQWPAFGHLAAEAELARRAGRAF
ncbi:MAG: tetratricopeptide repeat protein [Thermoanaerobaculia bacterium]